MVFGPRLWLFLFVFVRFFRAFLFAFAYNVLVGVRSSFLFPVGCAVFSLPSVSVVSRAACRAGASGFAVRPSSRGLGGFVAAVGFRRPAFAAAFAASFAAVLPAVCRGCVVAVSGGLSWVSVPVLPASVPAVVRSGAPLVAVGSPPAVRAAFLAGGVWSVWPAPFPAPPGRGAAWPVRPAPGARRLAFAAFFALGWPLPPRAPRAALPVFGSRVLARAWAVACGSAASCSPAAGGGGWVSAPGPALVPSCLFCGLLGACVSPPGAGCGFRPWRSLPGWPAAVPSPVLSAPLFPLSASPPGPARLPGF